LQERDPRWLVQSRNDGKNVNGWHWEEKGRLEWAKQRLRELLPAIPPAEAGNLRITEVTDVVGEVRLCICCLRVKAMGDWAEAAAN
jgi:activator of HSP90 ATPase